MKSAVCMAAAALLAGVYTGYFASAPWLPMFFFCVVAAAFIKWILSRRASGAAFSAAALAFVLGAFLVTYQGDVTTQKLYPYLDEYVTVKAEAAEKPQTEDGKTILKAKIIELTFLESHIMPNETIRLTVRGGGEALRFGDVFTARIRMNLPVEAANKGGFNYELYLKTQGIFFSGYVDGDSLQVTGRKDFGLLDRIQAVRYQCGDQIDRILTPNTAAILKGILLGDTSDVSDELRENFSRSGLSHIMAVSGMHVSTLLVLIFAVFRFFRMKKRIAGIFAALFIVLFVCFTGASPSAVRAGIMAIMAIAAELIYRRAEPFRSLAVAAFLILIFQPFAAFDISFLLSFGAVLGILLFSGRIEHAVGKRFGWEGTQQKTHRQKLAEKLVSVLAMTLSAQLITIPILLYYFQEFTVWCFITNLIILPLLPFIMCSGILLCVFGFLFEPIAVLAGGLCYVFLAAVYGVVSFFGTLGFGSVVHGQVSAFFIFLYLLFLAFFYFVLDGRRRVAAWVPAGSLAALLVVAAVHGTFTADLAQVMFINVGQGDSSCISLPNGIDVLIDAGGTHSYQDYYDVGKNTVRPYLLQHGVDDIEFMIATHAHEDHISGLLSILREMTVDHLIVPIGFGETQSGKKLLEEAKNASVPVYEFAAGDRIEFAPDAELAALMPTQDWAAGLSEDEENNRSLILRFTYGEHSFLYMGDLEAGGEEYLLASEGENLSADVLKVGHHGSSTSTTQPFLDAVEPAYAYIPVGENTYGHPAPEVLKRLEDGGTVVFRADQNKDVVFTVDRNYITQISYTKGGN